MFCIKICFLEPEPVEAELLRVAPEPKPKKNIWSQSPGKMAWLRNTAHNLRVRAPGHEEQLLLLARLGGSLKTKPNIKYTTWSTIE